MAYRITRTKSEAAFVGCRPHSSYNPPPYNSAKNYSDQQNIFTSKQILDSLRQLIDDTRQRRMILEEMDSKDGRLSSLITNRTESQFSTITGNKHSRNQGQVSPWETKSAAQSQFFSFQPIASIVKKRCANSPYFQNERSRPAAVLPSLAKKSQYFSYSPYEAISIKSPFDLDIHTKRNTPQTTFRTTMNTQINEMSSIKKDSDCVARAAYNECLTERNRWESKYQSLEKQIQILKHQKALRNIDKDRQTMRLRIRNEELQEQAKRTSLRHKLLDQEIEWFVKEEIDKHKDAAQKQCEMVFKGHKDQIKKIFDDTYAR